MAKEGLYHYRNLTLAHEPNSLEKVIKALLDSSEARARAARVASDSAALADVDDLEAVRACVRSRVSCACAPCLRAHARTHARASHGHIRTAPRAPRRPHNFARR